MVVCALLAGCISPAPNSGNFCYRNPFDPSENHPLVSDIATKTLADHGVEVTDLLVTNKTRQSPNRRGRILLPHEDSLIIGYDVWAHVAQCEEGQVLVQFGKTCQIQQMYTRYGCDIPGIPSY